LFAAPKEFASTLNRFRLQALARSIKMCRVHSNNAYLTQWRLFKAHTAEKQAQSSCCLALPSFNLLSFWACNLGYIFFRHLAYPITTKTNAIAILKKYSFY
jgi:hypothetical protein